MAFDNVIKDAVSSYVNAHLPNDQFYIEYFWFISDVSLKTRITEEFKAARYIYKLLEGLQVSDELLTAECKIQILLYASIYEAILHHVLLTDYSNTQEVMEITTYKHNKKINLSRDLIDKIERKYNPKGELIVFDQEQSPVDERKITFESKADAAQKLGLIDSNIKKIICDIYSMRNAIHLHAEIRRGINFDLESAQKAYWYLQGFTQQVGDKLEKDGKATRPLSSP